MKSLTNLDELISYLKTIKKEHGNLPLYQVSGANDVLAMENYFPLGVQKVYVPKHSHSDDLYFDDYVINDEDLENVDLSEPIIKALVL